ncbi:Retrovirus-related Pol poly from transposon [Paramuricea clavata]|uniref:Retrovirus-related Pol poly from transposon n=1 Tax=Paramuricea clavata TaxID=317549 RepID=A0A7D9IRC5_PARCT|nr:Retrovirus-related Pol poly from transposon [Paramuricea clavata]
MAAESERATKFNQVGRVKSSPKVSKIETGVPPRPAESPNAHDSEILATLKAIQAELNTVQSEVASLRTKVDQKDSPQGHPPSSTFMTGCVGQNRRNDGRQGDYPPLCKKCHEENQVGKREEATPEGLGVAASNQNKSHRCNGGNREEVHAKFKRCSTCKLVYCCSKSCQKRHWSEHQILCNAIKEQLNQNNETLRGLGDSSDTEMFASHLSPKKHAAIAKLVGRKCSVWCLVNDVDMEALWDTGAQVSIFLEQVLSDNFSDLKISDIRELLGAGSGLNLTAANGTSIPYKGWVEARFRLNREDEKEVMRVIAYASRTLTQAEKNYHLHTGKLEFLALKWAVSEQFRDYLYYAPCILRSLY